MMFHGLFFDSVSWKKKNQTNVRSFSVVKKVTLIYLYDSRVGFSFTSLVTFDAANRDSIDWNQSEKKFT
ncbi:hypothetical protein RUM44_011021 [Polyplax serrata]|uniref:Uncharacterized protein n=1 Tax=Polyplax serrata TaxID=468196 RepID=A0ABR1AQK8_POLSC